MGANRRCHRIFEKKKKSKGIEKILETNELDKNQTVAFFATVQKEGDKIVEREIEYFRFR